MENHKYEIEQHPSIITAYIPSSQTKIMGETR